MIAEKLGRVVWHDLFTRNRKRAMAFYQRLAGWRYVTEHATDFAWGGGEKDFVLALLADEAGAGFAETPQAFQDGWIAYVEVRDVDAAALQAEELGGAVVRAPFDVPGVGRNALLADPFGALIGISLSRHSFPAPRSQFGPEIYLSDRAVFPDAFYRTLFDWRAASAQSAGPAGCAICGPSGETVALRHSATLPRAAGALWLPSLKVADPQAALCHGQELGAKPFNGTSGEPAQRPYCMLQDPDGSLLRLLGAPDE
ncbi:VOC family protein [Hoeflea prorocentri]|uniref:VOC family protein n=1 Tax=Hoeflea prorocentri TaxID=1922333 RepID=A0A9X3ZJ58_9HYPH|nr:VOC family protein [Hoeflea prorocentri]MCY6383622.1 VOC family protein [Hoeflea prorocentri]MDA5401422.1 VOC family protein [Hoeflea prorocentri]